jgi:titin
VPEAPTGVTASGSYSSIKVWWSAPASNGAAITGYRAAASPGPAGCSVGPTETSCVIGAEAGTAYTVSVVALSAAGASPASDPSGTVVPSAPAVSSIPPETSLPLDTADGPISSATPGEALVVKGSGYAPYSTITIAIYSSPQVLASVLADGQGAFEQSVTVPEGLTAGTHSFVAAGVDEDGNVRALRLDLTVAAAGTSTGTLPITGPAVIWLVVGGFALTLAGLAMRLVKRQ